MENSIEGFFVYLETNHKKVLPNPFVFKLNPSDTHNRCIYSLIKIYEVYKKEYFFSTLSYTRFSEIVSMLYSTGTRNTIYHRSHNGCSFIDIDGLTESLRPPISPNDSLSIESFFSTLELSHRSLLSNPYTYKQSPLDANNRCMYTLDDVYALYKQHGGSYNVDEFFNYIFSTYSNAKNGIIYYGDVQFGGLSLVDTKHDSKLDLPTFQTNFTLPCNIKITANGCLSVVPVQSNIIGWNMPSLTSYQTTVYFSDILKNLYKFLACSPYIYGSCSLHITNELFGFFSNGALICNIDTVIEPPDHILCRRFNYGDYSNNFFVFCSESKEPLSVYIINGNWSLGNSVFIDDKHIASTYFEGWKHIYTLSTSSH